MKVEINLPTFPGFYSGILDLDNFICDDNITDEEYSNIDWNKYREDIGKLYLELFLESIPEKLKEIVKLKYIKIDSPKYYNYSTDKLVCEASFNKRKFINYFLRNMNNDYFKMDLLDKFTSRPGFISHYSNNIDEWLDNLIEDCNKDNVVFETMLEHLCYMYMEELLDDSFHIMDEGQVFTKIHEQISIY